jgi:predicted HicB family RNase H-like nuclease
MIEDGDDESTSRTTLRLPDSLKARAEAAASADGISLNAWFVRAVGAALEPRRSAPQTHGNSFTGWVR